jgi:hypothetical protein
MGGVDAEAARRCGRRVGGGGRGGRGDTRRHRQGHTGNTGRYGYTSNRGHNIPPMWTVTPDDLFARSGDSQWTEAGGRLVATE